MINMGDILDIEILDMSHDGEGIGKAEKLTVFVEDAVVGDIVKIKITQMKKNFAKGTVVECLKYSANRIKAICNLTSQCGGCQIQELSYEKQLEIKENLVINNLRRIGGFSDSDQLVNHIIGMVNPFGYRNKAQYPIGIKDGKVQIGFYKRKSHEVVACDKCALQPDIAEDIIKIIKRYAEEYHISVYDEQTKQGLLRHVILKFGTNTSEIMVVIVTNGLELPHKKELVKWLTTDISGITSIIQNINTNRSSLVTGNQWFTLYGTDSVKDTLGHLTFEISPLSFYQVNPVQMKVLYDQVAEYAHLSGSETVFDLYCGVGTIGLYLAHKAKKIIGIEAVKEAIADAEKNAKLNGILNAEFIVGKAEQVVPKLYEQGQKADVVILDPPRKGCDERLLKTILDIKSDKIVYVSCNPSTLARDLKYLCAKGYELKEVQPVDMFPHTYHVETVVLMSRVDK